MKNPSSNLALIPQPQKIQLKAEAFEALRSTPIRLSPGSPAMRAMAADLKTHLKPSGAKGRGEIRLSLSRACASLGPEGYRLRITNSGVRLEAFKEPGLYYGIQTLRQLLDRGPRLPGLLIEDWPRYAWRGFMLDTCRHFFPVSYILKQIDLLARHKMNRFHWHLTEDQAWRLEIKKYPRLTSVGAWRREDGSRYGGFYTQKQVKQVLAYAKARHVMVIPEIEIPGHSMAALSAYPHLGCNGGPYQVQTGWGIFQDVYCPGKESTFRFLEGVLEEVARLFPAPYIHIGGDECPKDRWQAHERCQARMRTEGLKDEKELQSWFLRRIQKKLGRLGKRMIGWDEIHEGGVPGDSIVHWWVNPAASREAAEHGHQVIASPHSSVYLDHSNSNNNVWQLYSYDLRPGGGGLRGAAAKRVIGGEAPLWTEWVKTQERADFQIWPRLSALAENLWLEEGRKDYADFEKRLGFHKLRLSKDGVALRDSGAPIGRWKRRDLSPRGKAKSWAFLAPSKPGRYRLTFEHRQGKDAVYLGKLSLKSGRRSISLKAHPDNRKLFSHWGIKPTRVSRVQRKYPEPMYEFTLLKSDLEKIMELKAGLKSKPGNDNDGSIYLKLISK